MFKLQYFTSCCIIARFCYKDICVLLVFLMESITNFGGDRLVAGRPKFGALLELGNSDFLEAIDKEPAAVTVIVHIFEKVTIQFWFNLHLFS